MQPPLEPSARALARIGGVLYLIVIALGLIQQLFVRGRLFVPGDATATSANLRSADGLWRAGILIELAMLVATVALGLVLYSLLKPVGKEVALLAAFFNLFASGVEASFALRALEALFPLGAATYLEAWEPEQLEAMVHLAARGYVAGFGIALLLFVPFFLATGTLVLRSGYLPRVLGLLYLLSGAGYLVLGLTEVFSPRLAGTIFPFAAGPAFVGEMSLCLWLLVKGVDQEAWNERQRASTPAPPDGAVLVP